MVSEYYSYHGKSSHRRHIWNTDQKYPDIHAHATTGRVAGSTDKAGRRRAAGNACQPTWRNLGRQDVLWNETRRTDCGHSLRPAANYTTMTAACDRDQEAEHHCWSRAVRLVVALRRVCPGARRDTDRKCDDKPDKQWNSAIKSKSIQQRASNVIFGTADY